MVGVLAGLALVVVEAMTPVPRPVVVLSETYGAMFWDIPEVARKEIARKTIVWDFIVIGVVLDRDRKVRKVEEDGSYAGGVLALSLVMVTMVVDVVILFLEIYPSILI